MQSVTVVHWTESKYSSATVSGVGTDIIDHAEPFQVQMISPLGTLPVTTHG